MDSEDTAKATALSFLSLPPEVRLPIYEHLLVHSSSIEPQFLRHPDYYSGIQRAQRALSNSRAHPIHLEAMPVLYGKNTFWYSCDMSILNDEDYLKVGFPDQNLQQIKHLKLQVQPKVDVEPILPVSVAATIQYFVNRGCDLQTFRMLLDEQKHSLLRAVAFSNEVCAALAGLKVSKTLTISISYSEQRTPIEHETRGTIGDSFGKRIRSLASQKNFTFMEEVAFDTEFLGANEDREAREDDSFEDSDEFFDEDDPDCYRTTYRFSWCLRPQNSKAQTDSASA